VEKLDIYQQLGVPEVWFWRRNRITVHGLAADGREYAEAEQSRALPAIDLVVLVSLLGLPSASQAMREYRALLGTR
jgi:Uma2 family endonuclease